MEIQVLWWQWVLLGMGLMILEIFLPSFIALWFGLGALVVGLVAWFFPHMGVSWEVCIWVFASSSFVLLWFKVFKPSMVDKTKAGISRDAALRMSGILFVWKKSLRATRCLSKTFLAIPLLFPNWAPRAFCYLLLLGWIAYV